MILMHTREFELRPGSEFFEGHFEGNPILPAVAQFLFVSEALAACQVQGDMLAIEAARFRLPVFPGELLTVSFPKPAVDGRLRFDILREGEPVTQGVIRVG